MVVVMVDVVATVDEEVMEVTVDMDMDANEDLQNPTMAVVDTEVATEVMVDVVVMVVNSNTTIPPLQISPKNLHLYTLSNPIFPSHHVPSSNNEYPKIIHKASCCLHVGSNSDLSLNW